MHSFVRLLLGKANGMLHKHMPRAMHPGFYVFFSIFLFKFGPRKIKTQSEKNENNLPKITKLNCSEGLSLGWSRLILGI